MLRKGATSRSCVWSSIAKDTSNFGKSTAEILELVANARE